MYVYVYMYTYNQKSGVQLDSYQDTFNYIQNKYKVIWENSHDAMRQKNKTKYIECHTILYEDETANSLQ